MNISNTLRLAAERFDSLYLRFEDVPSFAIETAELAPPFLEGIKGGKKAFLSSLSVLPLTYEFLDRASGAFVICTRQISEDQTTFSALLEITHESAIGFSAMYEWDFQTEAWNNAIACLPEKLQHAFYANFNGMHFSHDLNFIMPFHEHLNLPNPIPSGWNNVQFFREDNRMRKASVEKLEKEMGNLQNVRIWLTSDWGDMILVNQNAQDKKLYHVKNKNFNGFFEVQNPEQVMDRYCLHVLSGEKNEFNFRA